MKGDDTAPPSTLPSLLTDGKRLPSKKFPNSQGLSIPRVRILTEPILSLFNLEEMTRLTETEFLTLYMEKSSLQKVMLTTYLKPRSAKPKETRMEFACEAALILALDHPGLLKGKQLLEDKDYFGIVWEGAQGGVLLDHAGKLNPETVVHLAVQLFEVFSYCHKKDISHLRLRPAHLLLQEPPRSQFWILKLAGLDETRNFAAKPLPQDTLSPYIAPEVYAGEACKGSDMWSCGVALHVLITGLLPFTDKEYSQAVKASKPLQPLFDSDIWTSDSFIDCQDLISSLLQWNPEARPSALQCLQHAYFHPIHSRTSQRHITTSISMLAAIHLARNQLKSEIKEFVLNSVKDQSHLVKLREAFRVLDSNGDGLISREELQCGLERVLSTEDAASQCAHILKAADFNDNGELDYTEFLLAAYNDTDLFSAENIKLAFDRLDLNGSGNIRAEELILMFKGAGKKKLNQELLNLRQNFANTIDFSEFRNMVLKSQIVGQE